MISQQRRDKNGGRNVAFFFSPLLSKSARIGCNYGQAGTEERKNVSAAASDAGPRHASGSERN